MIEVIKTNPYNLPVGVRLELSPDSGMYESEEYNEDVGDGYELIVQHYYSFSPPFYDDNKEIFNQVKLEETNEKNKNIEGPESSETDSESENILYSDEAKYRSLSDATRDVREELQRTQMEERSEASKGGRPCVYETRFETEEDEFKEDRTEDQRTVNSIAIEKSMYKLLTHLSTYRTIIERETYTLRDLLEVQYKNLR